MRGAEVEAGGGVARQQYQLKGWTKDKKTDLLNNVYGFEQPISHHMFTYQFCMDKEWMSPFFIQYSNY